MKESILELIEKSPGYATNLKLSNKELEIFKFYISEQWLKNIRENNLDLASWIIDNNFKIENYHKISKELNHSKIWPKSSRILPFQFLEEFQNTNFFNQLKKLFNVVEISDEEDLGYGNIYWRLVRPNEKSDVGPIHRDSWFWQLNKNFPKPLYPFKRIKVWIAIETQPLKSGLLIEDNSHLREDIKWKGEIRHGIVKPLLLSDMKEFDMKLISTNPGESIIFNDNLVHGGALNKGNKTRVSLEFTLLCNLFND